MKDVLMSFTLSKDKQERSKHLKVYDDLIINNIYRVLEHFGTRMDVGLGSCHVQFIEAKILWVFPLT